MQKTLSIITVCYNSSETIMGTIKSVVEVKKTFPAIEYIIVDGDSNDGTIEIIRSYKDYVDILVSKNDTGIYNAMNKGVNLANGEYISFLNADDQYVVNHFDEIYRLMKEGRYDYIYGNLVRDDGKSKSVTKPVSETRAKKYGYMTPTLTQPASFIKKKIYNEIGGFDEQFSIAGDTDFLVRLLLKKKYKGKYLDIPITNFNTTGISSKLTNYKEHKLIRDKYNINYFKFYRFIIESSLKRFVYKSFRKIFVS